MSVWFITGASRGLGAEIGRQALAQGHQVVATARDTDAVDRAFPDAGDSLLAVGLDVTDEQTIRTAVDTALTRFGRIDVLVNNAGRGLVAAVEEASDPAVRALFDINFFGALNTLRAVLPTLRVQRSGHVITAALQPPPVPAIMLRRSSPSKACPKLSTPNWPLWASTSPSLNPVVSAPTSSTTQASTPNPT